MTVTKLPPDILAAIDRIETKLNEVLTVAVQYGYEAAQHGVSLEQATSDIVEAHRQGRLMSALVKPAGNGRQM